MLQNIRDRVQGTLAKIIIAAIVVPFALFGIDAFFTGGVPEVAKVNGEEITEPELAQAIELQRRRIINQSRDQVDGSLLEESVLRGPVLQQLIQRELIEQVAAKGGLSVPREMVDSVIINDENFQEDGAFSPARFEGLLRSSGLSPALYRDMMGEELTLRQVTTGLVQSEFVTRAELEIAARILQQKRDLRYLIVPAISEDELPVPGEEELRARYEATADRWVTQETVDLQYVELRQDQLLSAIDEQRIRDEYDRRAQNLQGSVERRAAHILIETGDGVDDAAAEQELTALKARIDAGESFADLAKDYSDDSYSAQSGGDLGFSAGDAFPAEFESALLAMQPGEVSGPIHSDAGWHLVKFLEQTSVEIPAYEQLHDEIERELQMSDAAGRLVQHVETLADLTFNADDLSEAATQLKLEVHDVAGVSRDAGDGVFADPRLRRAAFADDVLNDGLNSQPVELAEDHVVVLRVVKHHQPEPLSFDAVRDQVSREWHDEQRRQLLLKRGDELITALRGGSKIDELAQQQDLEWQVIFGATRTGGGLDASIQQLAFSMPPPASAAVSLDSAVLPDGRLAVVEVSKVEPGSLAEMGDALTAQLRDAVRQTRAQALLDNFVVGLRQEADIELL